MNPLGEHGLIRYVGTEIGRWIRHTMTWGRRSQLIFWGGALPIG